MFDQIFSFHLQIAYMYMLPVVILSLSVEFLIFIVVGHAYGINYAGLIDGTIPGTCQNSHKLITKLKLRGVI